MPTPLSFIKNLAFELSTNEVIDNAPYEICKTKIEYANVRNRIFVGREQQGEKFLSFFRSKPERGVFLVTGYRGMGKTSFVNRYLNEYKWLTHQKDHDPESIIPIHLTLSQNNIKEIDILKLITRSLYDKYKTFSANQEREIRNAQKKEKSSNSKKVRAINSYTELETLNESINRTKTKLIKNGLALIVFCISISQQRLIKEIFTFNNDILSKTTVESLTDIVKLFLISFFFFFASKFIYYGWFFLKQSNLEKTLNRKDTAYNRIKWIIERSHSEISEEHIKQSEGDVRGFSIKLGLGSKKRAKSYPLANSKEIEYELQQFLQKAKAEESKLKFIFIFDELDKVEQVVSNSYLNSDLESFENGKRNNINDLREKQQTILNTISALKNFFTTAEARFIFIAGHEMFDASLADIADRQSSIGSIFTYTFHIESLLKEKKIGKLGDSKASLSASIEEILKGVLFPSSSNDESTLYELVLSNKCCFDFGDSGAAENNTVLAAVKNKVYFVLQNFVVYLTYRSNGSPKKLIKLINEFIYILNAENLNSNKGKERNIIWQPFKKNSAGNKKYLYFNYNNQYRIGLLSYLYRPFLIEYGRSFKQQSDSIVLATPYLLDHLLKFHPFAFSLSNLELIPEVLSTTKTVYLKEHIQRIIRYLSQNHLRETEIGLFDYKFYSRTQNEVSFISKIFDDESAAFNFTLDESFLVKLHINNKIKELRSIYSKFLSSNERSNKIFSIAHLNGNLGDLYFFDQEFDDAIVSYSDAIRPINNIEVETMNMRDFITLIRNKLKLGLCFEKINSFEEALAFYSDACQDTKRFFVHRINYGIPLERGSLEQEGQNTTVGCAEKTGRVNPPEVYVSSSFSDLLQVVIQPFLAKIIIQEKMGVEGISTRKLNIALGSFLTLANQFKTKSGNDRNHLIISNAYLLIGKLLYFKNSQSPTDTSNDAINELPGDMKDWLPILISNYSEMISISLAEDQKEPFIEAPTRRMPFLALCFYIKGLDEVFQSRNLLNGLMAAIIKYNEENIVTYVITFAEAFLKSADESFTSFHGRYIAGYLSSIGDCLLSMTNEKKTNEYNEYKPTGIFDFENTQDEDGFDIKLNKNNSKAVSITDVLRCYYLSARLFLKNGKNVSCSFQYRKILHTLRMVITKDEKDSANNMKLIALINRQVVQPALLIASYTSGNTDIHMRKKASDSLQQSDTGSSNKFMLAAISNNISNHPETRELILLLYYLKIKLGVSITESEVSLLISPYNSIATQIGRVMELDFYAKYVTHKIEADGLKPKLENCVAYLHSMLSILRILKVYGKDYFIGSSYYAYTHFRIAEFLYQLKEQPAAFIHSINKELSTFMGSGNTASLEFTYHYRMAKQYYEESYQLHTAGREYRNFLLNMIYLEDDFNDNAYHFGAAMDRYLLVNGVFKYMITECDKKLNVCCGSSVQDFIA